MSDKKVFTRGDIVFLGLVFGNQHGWVGVVTTPGVVGGERYSGLAPMVSWWMTLRGGLTSPTSAGFKQLEYIGKVPEEVDWNGVPE